MTAQVDRQRPKQFRNFRGKIILDICPFAKSMK
jgi:hypothetical protein